MFQILPDNKNSVDYGGEENLTLFNCINNPREERFALGSVDETPNANELEPTNNCTKMQIVAREVKFQGNLIKLSLGGCALYLFPHCFR